MLPVGPSRTESLRLGYSKVNIYHWNTNAYKNVAQESLLFCYNSSTRHKMFAPFLNVKLHVFLPPAQTWDQRRGRNQRIRSPWLELFDANTSSWSSGDAHTVVRYLCSSVRSRVPYYSFYAKSTSRVVMSASRETMSNYGQPVASWTSSVGLQRPGAVTQAVFSP